MTSNPEGTIKELKSIFKQQFKDSVEVEMPTLSEMISRDCNEVRKILQLIPGSIHSIQDFLTIHGNFDSIALLKIIKDELTRNQKIDGHKLVLLLFDYVKRKERF